MQLGLHMGPPTTEAEAVHESVAFLGYPIPLVGPPCLASDKGDRQEKIMRYNDQSTQ